MRFVFAALALSSSCSFFAACSDSGSDTADDQAPAGYKDLGLGAVEDLKEDGNWGAALTCKAIPSLTPLKDPMIVVSLDGLTLHLWDRQGTYDKVFPIGPGAIENGKSLTPVSTGKADGLYWTHTDTAQGVDGQTSNKAVWSWNYRCKLWWQDEDTGAWVPVFAGLPFIRLDGPPSSGYALHGPIDKYTAANGGTLHRGFVSHGCVRMEAADIVEVYALIQGHKTPVRIQQAVERRADETAVDIAAKWVEQECKVDADCNFDGGFCHKNSYSGRSFCTARCTRTCADKTGYPPTFCVADPDDTTKGMCVSKLESSGNNFCRRYDSQVAKTGTARFGQPTVKADVCLPGSEGWMGDRCKVSSECSGGACAPVDDGNIGVCTQTCSRSCPDKANYAPTFCVKASEESGLSDGMCVATCFNNDDCAIGTTCEVEARNGVASVTKKVCLPY